MNPVRPNKLQLSKWTALQPRDKEKHFLVTQVEYDEEGRVSLCLLEAIMSKHEYSIDWTELKDAARWRQGWH
ncbi:TIGR02450 family Trp-rich protein [Marinospirillum sp. MEB164]|uniref:TIGR02450 family Trp-rich protein n=1 Tax=Marinospirillum alkalitolerans TaxID=3123374 RepID=A0ABW8PV97_9GAMM